MSINQLRPNFIQSGQPNLINAKNEIVKDKIRINKGNFASVWQY